MPTRITAGYAALMGALAVAVLTLPDWAGAIWAVVGVLAAGATVFGTRLHAPLRPASWWLLGAAMAVMAAGDTVYGMAVHRAGDPTPLLADIAYVAMFPLVGAGLLQMTRTSVVLRDRSRLLDLLTFSCAAGLLSWILLIRPALLSGSLGAADKSLAVAYALGDLLILITTVRLVVAASRSWAVVLLVAGSVALLVADVSYAMAQLHSGWQPGSPGDLVYVVFYLAWGAAALQPSMVDLTMPVDPRLVQRASRWMAPVGLSLSIPPVVLLVESMLGGIRDGVMIAVASMVMAVFVVTRLSDAIVRYRGAVDRERVLREACVTLVAATDTATVGTTVRAAVTRLVPGRLAHAVVLGIDDPVTTGLSGAGLARLLPTRILHPELREQLTPFPTTLVSPLALDAGGGAAPGGAVGSSALFIAADDRVLYGMHEAVRVLVAQAALALERIMLTEAAIQRDSDQYVQAVVRNTVDVVVIIDADECIRYASPSLSTVLGVDPPVFGKLADLVHPDDREQVERTLRQVKRASGADGVRDSWSLRRVDGDRVQIDVSYRDLRRDRLVRGFVLTMRDVTERQRHELELIQRAVQDSPAAQNRQSSRNKFT